MNVKIRPLDRLNDEALQLLVRELGHAKTARFLQQFSTGSSNYTEDRKDYFKNRMLEDLVRDIKAGNLSVADKRVVFQANTRLCALFLCSSTNRSNVRLAL